MASSLGGTHNPDVLTCYALLFTALFYLLVGGLRGELEWVTRPRFLLDMAQLAVLSTIVSARLLVSAVKLVGSVPTSILGTLEPLTAIVVGILHFHERLSAANVAGLVIVLAAVLVVILKRRCPPPAPSPLRPRGIPIPRMEQKRNKSETKANQKRLHSLLLCFSSGFTLPMKRARYRDGQPPINRRGMWRRVEISRIFAP